MFGSCFRTLAVILFHIFVVQHYCVLFFCFFFFFYYITYCNRKLFQTFFFFLTWMGGFWCALKKNKKTPHLYGRFLVCTAWLILFFLNSGSGMWPWWNLPTLYLLAAKWQLSPGVQVSLLLFHVTSAKYYYHPFLIFFLFFFLLWMVLPYKVAANIVIHFDVCVFSPVAFVCYYHTIKHGYFWGLISWFVLYHFTASWTSLLYTT